MTFPLGSLRSDTGTSLTAAAHGAAAAPSGPATPSAGLRSQAIVLVGGLLCLLALIALLTYHPADPAFSTSGSRLEALHNKAGAIGA